MIDRVQIRIGVGLIGLFFILATIDYAIQLNRVLHIDEKFFWKAHKADEN